MAENNKPESVFSHGKFREYKKVFGTMRQSIGDLLDPHIEEKARLAFMPYFPKHIVTPAHRDGIGYREKDIDKVVDTGWRFTLGGFAMQLEENLNNAIVEAEDARKRLSEILTKFRSSAKNDLSSIEAIGKHIRQEMVRIQQSMNLAIDVMTDTPMIKAIENAQKLAAALESIDKLRTTKIGFAIIDGK